MGIRWLVVVFGLLGICGCGEDVSVPDLTYACHIASYTNDSGQVVDIAPLSVAGLRWRASSGETGRITPDGSGVWSGTRGWTEDASPVRIRFGDCPGVALELTGLPGFNGTYTRQRPEVFDTRFVSHDLTLAGRLVLPRVSGPVTVVVLVHGSERSSALDFNHLQRLLPALGVGAFVYDKRGTGASDGDYTQNFELLADDAAAALAEARRLAGSRAARVGYQGASQGGWVAPLAATRSAADFVAVSFGMLESPLIEDAMQAQLDVQALGYDDDVLVKVRELTDATGRVLASDFKEGADELAALKQAYSDEEWFDAVRGEVTGHMLSAPLWGFRFVYQYVLGADTSWGYEPMPTARSIDVPVLWVVAADDVEAPPQGTLRALAELQTEQRDVAVAVFPDSDHGILNYIETAAGRVSTRYADGYFRLLADWLRSGELQGAYGSATVVPSPVNDL
ncbi:MAG: alpha/beta hydrolase [Pseudomonadota bacterium]